jgi:hypothetical protein
MGALVRLLGYVALWAFLSSAIVLGVAGFALLAGLAWQAIL